MKVKLTKDIIGRNNDKERLHGRFGDELKVLVQHKDYFTCDSKYYPHTPIIVFRNQANEIREHKSLEEINFENQLDHGILFEQTE